MASIGPIPLSFTAIASLSREDGSYESLAKELAVHLRNEYKKTVAEGSGNKMAIETLLSKTRILCRWFPGVIDDIQDLICSECSKSYTSRLIQ